MGREETITETRCYEVESATESGWEWECQDYGYAGEIFSEPYDSAIDASGNIWEGGGDIGEDLAAELEASIENDD